MSSLTRRMQRMNDRKVKDRLMDMRPGRLLGTKNPRAKDLLARLERERK